MLIRKREKRRGNNGRTEPKQTEKEGRKEAKGGINNTFSEGLRAIPEEEAMIREKH